LILVYSIGLNMRHHRRRIDPNANWRNIKQNGCEASEHEVSHQTSPSLSKQPHAPYSLESVSPSGRKMRCPYAIPRFRISSSLWRKETDFPSMTIPGRIPSPYSSNQSADSRSSF